MEENIWFESLTAVDHDSVLTVGPEFLENFMNNRCTHMRYTTYGGNSTHHREKLLHKAVPSNHSGHRSNSITQNHIVIYFFHHSVTATILTWFVKQHYFSLMFTVIHETEGAVSRTMTKTFSRPLSFTTHGQFDVSESDIGGKPPNWSCVLKVFITP